MHFKMKIEMNLIHASFAEHGNADDIEFTARYISSRSEAHQALDKVLDALGVEDK